MDDDEEFKAACEQANEIDDFQVACEVANAIDDYEAFRPHTSCDYGRMFGEAGV